MPKIPDNLPASTLVTVYEGANAALREIWVGLSMHLIGEIETRLRARRELAHWKPDHRITVRAIEYSIPLRDAYDFVRRYEEARASAGWTVISDATIPDAGEFRAQIRSKGHIGR